jgi:hypothetical protein
LGKELSDITQKRFEVIDQPIGDQFVAVCIQMPRVTKKVMPELKVLEKFRKMILEFTCARV